MAGPLQVGDIINLGKIAWDIYKFGWSDDLNATRQYREFFGDVRGLAQNLDTLSSVVNSASEQLSRQGTYAVARWHPSSLYQIIGDYHNTLRECRELINTNWRYGENSSVLRNLEWNMLVQPSADQLRQRILLHNSKVAQVLKPFEIDLMCRVRDDIRNMHNDLAGRLIAIHRDIRLSMGVTVANLDEELNQQAQRRTYLLEVPLDIENRFRLAALTERPDFDTDDTIPVEELSDAFTFNYLRSTHDFQGGIIVSDCEPPLDKYLNLLKCIWILRKLKDASCVQGADPDSHWPSYVGRLEDDLTMECRRFGTKLIAPNLLSVPLRGHLLSIWPEREPAPLVDVVTKEELMEQLLEVKLQSSTASVEREAKLLRRMNCNDRKFRVMITGMEQTAAGRPRQQTETIDFDITTATINPQYALPYARGFIREIILRRDEKIAKLAFNNMPDLLKFQQAVTGFKAWASYTQLVRVGWVISGRKDHIHEEACLQLWIPKAMDGSLVTNSDAAADANKMRSPSRTGSMASTNTNFSPTSPSMRRDSFAMSNPFGISGETLTSPMGRQPSLPTIPQRQTPDPGLFSMSWPRQTSPNPMGSSPPRQGFMPPPPGPPRGAPTRRPVGQPPSPRRSNTQATTVFNTTNGGAMFGRTERAFSMSSALSTTAVSTTSNSSNSDGQSVVSTGAHTKSILHRRPPKPMLVLYTHNPKDGQLSFVTIQIDEETNVNPDICNCRRSGREGANCPDAGIERRKGDLNLEARRYVNPRGNELDWNMARLALNNPTSTNPEHNWPNLKRVTITFPNARERAIFGGMPNVCQCKIKDKGTLDNCLKQGHRGYWGEVQEHYRKRGNEYHERRHGSKKHVVDRLLNGLS